MGIDSASLSALKLMFEAQIFLIKPVWISEIKIKIAYLRGENDEIFIKNSQSGIIYRLGYCFYYEHYDYYF